MGNIVINSDRNLQITAVPNIFIDKFLPSARDSYVKIYLYLLRCTTSQAPAFDVSNMADYLSETEGDILRALKYWEKNNVIALTKEGSELTGITFLDLTHTTPSGDEPSNSKKSTNVSDPDSGSEAESNTGRQSSNANGTVSRQSSLGDTNHGVAPVISIAERRADAERKINYENYISAPVDDDTKVEWIMSVVSQFVSRLLTAHEAGFIKYLYTDLGFSDDLILHLYDYCVNTKHKTRFEYIESVALNWAANEIKTQKQAEEFSIVFDDLYAAVNKAFSMDRRPGDAERQFIKKWHKLGLSPELVKEACDRTMLRIYKPDFKYAHKILKDWVDSGVKTLEDVKKYDALHSGSKKASGSGETDTAAAARRKVTKSAEAYNSYPQRNYSDDDWDALERDLSSK